MKTQLTLSLAAILAVFFTGTERANSQTPIPNMVWIRPGTFTMGSPTNEAGRHFWEGPQTQVTISQGFWMGRYEVTQGEYLAVRGINPSHFNGVQGGVNYGIDLNRPVEEVNWVDAVKYCTNLTAQERNAGRLPSEYVYRLPTAAEWEYACRAGTSTAFHYGPALRSGMANFLGKYEYPPCDEDPRVCYNPEGTFLGRTTNVGSYAPNAWGLHDMHGNVWEWCSDWYSGSLLPGGSVIDPQGPATSTERVMRGGSWVNIGVLCRSAYLRSGDPGYRNNIFGFRVVLATTVPDWRQTIEAPQAKPVYSDCPARQPGKENLIVVTHGWTRLLDPSSSTDWVSDMTNHIANYLSSNHMDNWQLHGHKWIEKSRTLFPQWAADHGELEGGILGNCIGFQRWSHVHLISHSAGDALIQAVAAKIKGVSSTNTVVHSTFLDPFIRTFQNDRHRYGNASDWSENYFGRDKETEILFQSFTEGPLDHAYNVDVTWLDPSKDRHDEFASSPAYEIVSCYTRKTSHGWPTVYYANTIPPIPTELEPGYNGFGFLLSKEGGGWGFATNQYPVGRNSLTNLGVAETPCVITRITSPISIPNSQLDFTGFPTKSAGSAQISGPLILLHTPGQQLAPGPGFQPASPPPAPTAWIATFVTVTSAVNFVNLESSFTSETGAEGLLTVYWDTNTIGAVDEQAVLPGLQQYSYVFPKAESNSLHVLSFRLNTFTDIASSVIVTNVTLGFAGVSEPFTLRATSNTSEGLQVLELTGQPGFNFYALASTNLIDWKAMATLINTNGIVRFVDRESTNFTQRFYRAVVP